VRRCATLASTTTPMVDNTTRRQARRRDARRTPHRPPAPRPRREGRPLRTPPSQPSSSHRGARPQRGGGRLRAPPSHIAGHGRSAGEVSFAHHPSHIAGRSAGEVSTIHLTSRGTAAARGRSASRTSFSHRGARPQREGGRRRVPPSHIAGHGRSAGEVSTIHLTSRGTDAARGGQLRALLRSRPAAARGSQRRRTSTSRSAPIRQAHSRRTEGSDHVIKSLRDDTMRSSLRARAPSAPPSRSLSVSRRA
jgi:hypothetical protein